MLDLNDLADEFDELVEKLESEDFDIDDQTELRKLRALEKELDRPLREAAEDEPCLVAEDEWEDYCRDMAENCGYLDGKVRDNPLYQHIDWKSWADNVADDYMTVEYDGQTYYYRNY